MDFRISFVLLLAVFSCISAENATFTACPEFPGSICTVTAVRITPCKESPGPCKLKKGNPAEISFDFTPQFSAMNSKMSLTYVNGVIKEPEFPALDKETCKFTTCPLETGKTATLNYRLILAKKLPNGLFPIRWKVIDEADSNNLCCFITKIQLRK